MIGRGIFGEGKGGHDHGMIGIRVDRDRNHQQAQSCVAELYLSHAPHA